MKFYTKENVKLFHTKKNAHKNVSVFFRKTLIIIYLPQPPQPLLLPQPLPEPELVFTTGFLQHEGSFA